MTSYERDVLKEKIERRAIYATARSAIAHKQGKFLLGRRYSAAADGYAELAEIIDGEARFYSPFRRPPNG